MTKFIETICIENGIIHNTELHLTRMRKTAQQFGYSCPSLPNLIAIIPDSLLRAKTKCRIVYSSIIEEITFSKYIPRTIGSLKITDGGDIEYQYKYHNRSAIQNLLSQKDDCDDIIIIKQGLVTDSSFSNIVFVKDNKYFTPESYLLNGTKRRELLSRKQIIATKIGVNDIYKYDGVLLINSMLGLDNPEALITVLKP